MSHVTSRLSSAGVDLVKAYEKHIPEDAWQRYLEGDKTVFARRILKSRDKYGVEEIRKRHQDDAEFRVHSTEYIAQFERLLEQAEAHDPEEMISATLLSSDVGKLYLLLSRALDRIK
jgi:hypothetical protein